jgi:hypothetical protein
MDEVEVEEHELAPPHILWWVTIGYAGLAALGWLSVAIYKVLRWRTRSAQAGIAAANGDLEFADQIQGFAGSLLVDMGFALVAVAVCTLVTVALLRRSWNAWDYATVTAWCATLASGIFVCANTRVMFWLPFTFAPILALLYTSGVKTTCGVRPSAAPSVPGDPATVTATSQVELERELARERTLVTQLRQNLNVFELEHSMSTDAFVQRYVGGLEDETPDNAEWFSIARAVRRSQDRIAELQTQLETQNEPGA